MTRKSSSLIRQLASQVPTQIPSPSFTSSMSMKKAAKTVKNDDVTAAIQKVLAVQSELMVYESIATELDRQYSETLQRQF
jgi:hypothetical protein